MLATFVDIFFPLYVFVKNSIVFLIRSCEMIGRIFFCKMFTNYCTLYCIQQYHIVIWTKSQDCCSKTNVSVQDRLIGGGLICAF